MIVAGWIFLISLMAGWVAYFAVRCVQAVRQNRERYRKIHHI